MKPKEMQGHVLRSIESAVWGDLDVLAEAEVQHMAMQQAAWAHAWFACTAAIPSGAPTGSPTLRVCNELADVVVKANEYYRALADLSATAEFLFGEQDRRLRMERRAEATTGAVATDADADVEPQS